MKRDELIKKLSELPEDAEICVSGYEGGVQDDFDVTGPHHVEWKKNDEWYYGPHEVVSEPTTETVVVYRLT